MSTFLPNIRVAVRAVIIRNGHLLLLRKQYEDGYEAFALPGGGLDLGETLEQALQRECREEIGSEVTMQELLHVADFFKHSSSHAPSRRHLVEVWFRCDIDADYIPVSGDDPDTHQIAVEWVNIQSLHKLNLQPPQLEQVITHPNQCDSPVYIGEIRDR